MRAVRRGPSYPGIACAVRAAAGQPLRSLPVCCGGSDYATPSSAFLSDLLTPSLLPPSRFAYVPAHQELCEECSMIRHKFALAGHKLVPFTRKSGLVADRRAKCQNGCPKKCEIYCEDCGVNLCTSCFRVLHNTNNMRVRPRRRARNSARAPILNRPL